MVTEKYFTYPSADGVTMISAKYYRPKDKKPIAILQISHGMVEYKERYDDFARYLAEHGFFVCSHDHLGHGDSVIDTDHWGYMTPDHPSDILIRDMHRLRRGIQKKYPNLPYFMLGHSMGSYMLRKYLSSHGEGLKGAIIMGTGYEGTIKPRFGLALVETLAKIKGWDYRSLAIQNMTYSKAYRKYDLTGKNPENSWLTKDTSIVKRYYSDPMCTYTFTMTGYKALLEAVKETADPGEISKIPADLPLLLVSGADDPVGNLGEGVKKVWDIYGKAGLNVTMKLYEGDRHEILNELDRVFVYEDLRNWMLLDIDGELDDCLEDNEPDNPESEDQPQTAAEDEINIEISRQIF